jgi:hypothetical protein
MMARVVPDFMQYFHVLMAKRINIWRGRWGMLRATRPRFQASACSLHVGPKMFFTENMPESVEFAVEVPEQPGARDEFVATLGRGIAEVEAACRESERRCFGNRCFDRQRRRTRTKSCRRG